MLSSHKIFPFAAAALLFCGACQNSSAPSGGNAPSNEPPDFVATIHPLAAILREVAGQAATVERLLPPGATPHAFEARPSDAKFAAKSKAMFYVALDLDGWALDLEAPQKIQLMLFVPEEEWIPSDPSKAHEGHGHEGHEGHDHGHEGHEGHDHGHEGHEGHDHGSSVDPAIIEAVYEVHEGHDHGEFDPHIWTDPVLVKAMLPAIVEALSKADPDNAKAYQKNAKDFETSLNLLHAELATILKPVKGQAVMTHHPSMRYFMRRYGLKDAGALIETPAAGLSTKKLQEILREAKADQVSAIFTEPQLSAGIPSNIAEALGVPLVELDPIGGVPGRETYADLMRFNALAIRKALQGAAEKPAAPLSPLEREKEAALAAAAAAYASGDAAARDAALERAQQAAEALEAKSEEPTEAQIQAALEAEMAKFEAEEAPAPEAAPAEPTEAQIQAALEAAMAESEAEAAAESAPEPEAAPSE